MNAPWIDGGGKTGRSAYQSYLSTTSDNPVMTEAQWASVAGNAGLNEAVARAEGARDQAQTAQTGAQTAQAAAEAVPGQITGADEVTSLADDSKFVGLSTASDFKNLAWGTLKLLLRRSQFNHSFKTYEDFETWVALEFLPEAPDGTIVELEDGHRFRALSGATLLPRLPGWVPVDGRWSPGHWGAKHGVTVDYGPEIQLAASAVRDSWNSSLGKWDARLDFHGYYFRTDQSIDFGGVGQPLMMVANGALYIVATSQIQIGLDMGYVNSARFHDFKVIGDAEYPPDWGLYYGRAKEFSDSGTTYKGTGGTTFTGHSGGDGYFARGATLAFAAEVCTWGTGVKWSNKHRSRKAVTVLHASSMLQVFMRFGSDTTSLFRTIPNSTLPATRHSNISHNWNSVEISRPSDVQMTLVSMTLTNPAVMAVGSGQLVSEDISEGDEIFISSGDCPDIEHKPFIVRNISGDTFQLYRWVLDDNDEETDVEEPVDATGFTAYTSGATIQNRTGPALAISGARILRTSGAYFTAFGNPVIEIETEWGSSCDEWNFQCQFERHSDKAITFVQPTLGTSTTCSNMFFMIPQISQQAHTAIVWRRGEGTIVLENSLLQVTNMLFAPSRGAIAPRAGFRLKNCRTHLPKALACPTEGLGNGDEWISITGEFNAYDRSPITRSVGLSLWDVLRLRLGSGGGTLEGRDIRYAGDNYVCYDAVQSAERPFMVSTRITKGQLLDATAPINAVGKYPGKPIWDTSNNRPLWARGSAATDPWVDGNNVVVHQPG